MKNTQYSLIATAFIACTSLSSQAIEIYNDEKTSLNFEGNLAVFYLRNSEGLSEVNDGFSRYLFNMDHRLKNDWVGIAKMEWGVQVSNTDDKIIVNKNSLTSTGPATSSIWLRQGYVGLGHDDYGRLTMGKQWGVSYDVGGVTDWFEIFGGTSSGTYNFGTDGGFSGSGRAEQAIQYRNSFGDFSFGAQFLASEDEIHIEGEDGSDFDATINFSDSYGVSVIYNFSDIVIGAAYNAVKLNLVAVDTASEKIDDELFSAFITYGVYGEQGFHIALAYADMKNHDINDVGQVMTDSTSIELYSVYRFENDISLILGYVSLEDKSNIVFGANGNFNENYVVLSAKYHMSDDFYIFIESKLDNSTLSDNTTSLAEDATGLGMMFTF